MGRTLPTSHEEHEEFIKPVDEHGRIAMLKLDDRNITRVKYHPPTYVHKQDVHGNDQVTNEICANGILKGLLEDGTVLPIPEQHSLGPGLWMSARDWGLESLFQFLWAPVDHL